MFKNCLMKTRSIIFFTMILMTLLLGVSNLSIAQERGKGFGLGIIIGEPTGVSAQKWLDNSSALAAAAAWSFAGRSSLNFHVDYQMYNFNLVQADKGEFSFYWGFGGRIVIQEKNNGTDVIVGARIPVGLNYHIEGAPVAVFGEIVPKLNLIPETRFDVGGGLGIRYFF